MQRCSIADFVTDVESVANSLPTRPVVIGHSMGGFVVQKYLETHDAPAGVLVASVSTRGAGGFLLRGMKRHPWHGIRSTVTTRSLHGYNTPKLAREYFYSPHTPEPMSCAMQHDLRKSSVGESRWTWFSSTCLSLSGHDAAPALGC